MPNALARVRARWFYKGMCSCVEASDLSDLDGMRDKVKKKVEIDFSGKNVPKKEMGSKPKEASKEGEYMTNFRRLPLCGVAFKVRVKSATTATVGPFPDVKV